MRIKLGPSFSGKKYILAILAKIICYVEVLNFEFTSQVFNVCKDKIIA